MPKSIAGLTSAQQASAVIHVPQQMIAAMDMIVKAVVVI